MSHPVDTRLPSASNLRVLGRGALSTGTGDILGRGGALVTTLLAARALAPAEFGSFIGLSAVAIFAAGVWDFGFSTLATREVAAGRTSIGAAVMAALRARLQTLVPWLVAFVAGSLILGTVGTFSIAVLAGFASASCLAATSMVPLALLRAKLQFHGASVAQACGRWLTAGLTAGALSWLGSEHGLTIVATAIAVGEALTLILAALFLWRGRLRGRSLRTKETPLRLRAAMPFAANGLLSMAYNRLDIIIVSGLTTASQIAAYAPASRIQDILYIVPGVVGVVAFPVIARTWGGRDGPEQTRALVAKFIAVGLAVAIPVSVLGTVFAPQAIRLALGPEYADAVTPTRILIWFLPLAVIQSPLLAALGASGRAGDTTRVFLSTFAVAVCMHLALDLRWGAVGAAMASLSRDVVAVPVTLALAVRAGVFAFPRARPPRIAGQESN